MFSPNIHCENLIWDAHIDLNFQLKITHTWIVLHMMITYIFTKFSYVWKMQNVIALKFWLMFFMKKVDEKLMRFGSQHEPSVRLVLQKCCLYDPMETLFWFCPYVWLTRPHLSPNWRPHAWLPSTIASLEATICAEHVWSCATPWKVHLYLVSPYGMKG